VGKKKKREKKEAKKLKKLLKKAQKDVLAKIAPHGCKTKCCEKYQKSEAKRCSRCPCFDLLKEKAA
jgi:hypothetical protein